MDRYWIVARVKPRSENWAVHNIVRQGLGYYLPKFAVGPAVKGQPQKTQYLFPSYIFVLTDGRWRCLMGTFGLFGVILVGENPAVMPESAIEDLKSREDTAGLVKLPGAGEVVSRFKPGEKVRVVSGPFEGHIGIYEGSSSRDRERILLDMLGTKTQVLIAGSYLQAA